MAEEQMLSCYTLSQQFFRKCCHPLCGSSVFLRQFGHASSSLSFGMPAQSTADYMLFLRASGLNASETGSYARWERFRPLGMAA